MASEGHQVRSTAALLRVSESGYYAWCRRAPSGRVLWHARLTELILSIYRSSEAMYGSRRIHHELQERYGINVSRGTVELLMRQAGIRGRAGRTRWAAGQMLDSRTARRLWVTDARAHHTPTGTVYCAVVLDTNQRRLMGWSVDRTATQELVHRALDAALVRDAEELPPVRTQHTRPTAYAFTEHMQTLALAPVTARVPDRHAQASVDLFWRRIGRSLLPRQYWNTPESLQTQLMSLLEDFST